VVCADVEGIASRPQHVPTSAAAASSNHCTNHQHNSPIYSKLLDDSMSSYDDPTHCVVGASSALAGGPPGPAAGAHAGPQTPASAPGGYVSPRGGPYDPPHGASDHIPRLHEAHPYWVLEQQQQQQQPVAAHHHYHHHHPASSAAAGGVHLPSGSLPAPSACWRPLLQPHGTQTCKEIPVAVGP